MKTSPKKRAYGYGIVLFLITLSGFGQMPIFSRYYIASIPGLGWLGEFYTTHILHYLSAFLLIALAVYVLCDFIAQGKKLKQITGSGFVKIGIISGLMISGGFMVLKNMSGIYLNHAAVIALDIIHLSLCMALLAASLYTLVFNKKWMK